MNVKRTTRTLALSVGGIIVGACSSSPDAADFAIDSTATDVAEVSLIRPDGTESQRVTIRHLAITRFPAANNGAGDSAGYFAPGADRPKPIIERIRPDRVPSGSDSLTVAIEARVPLDSVVIRSFSGGAAAYPVHRAADGGQRVHLPATVLATPTILLINRPHFDGPADARPLLVYDSSLPSDLGEFIQIDVVELQREDNQLLVSVNSDAARDIVLGRGETPAVVLRTVGTRGWERIAILPADTLTWHLGAADDYFLTTLDYGGTVSAPYPIPSDLRRKEPGYVAPHSAPRGRCPEWTIGDNYTPGDVELTAVRPRGSWVVYVRGVGLRAGLTVVVRFRDRHDEIVQERFGVLETPRFFTPDAPAPTACFPGPRVREQFAQVRWES